MSRSVSSAFGLCLWLIYFPHSNAHRSQREVALQELTFPDHLWYFGSSGKIVPFGYKSRNAGVPIEKLTKNKMIAILRNSMGNHQHPMAVGDNRNLIFDAFVRQRPTASLFRNLPFTNAARYNTYLDTDSDVRLRRKFPEIDSRGFDEDVFDEGFGEWSPMKRGK
ncbi:uncharacterized protein LOC111087725 [Limulus polyphemus]|uniref:Uncharacterized protein LOC111087725 n=1 Tax=Limulus polyphemus TaxID=6850 RepID=A0ABM1T5B1_LIMPO|nr:uncharacterized protein LOC111087725 [Limulus polyphemus]